MSAEQPPHGPDQKKEVPRNEAPKSDSETSKEKPERRERKEKPKDKKGRTAEEILASLEKLAESAPERIAERAEEDRRRKEEEANKKARRDGEHRSDAHHEEGHHGATKEGRFGKVAKKIKALGPGAVYAATGLAAFEAGSVGIAGAGVVAGFFGVPQGYVVASFIGKTILLPSLAIAAPIAAIGSIIFFTPQILDRIIKLFKLSAGDGGHAAAPKKASGSGSGGHGGGGGHH